MLLLLPDVDSGGRGSPTAPSGRGGEGEEPCGDRRGYGRGDGGVSRASPSFPSLPVARAVGPGMKRGRTVCREAALWAGGSLPVPGCPVESLGGVGWVD